MAEGTGSQRQRDTQGRFVPEDESADDAEEQVSGTSDGSDGQPADSSGEKVDISDTPAPSVGPNTKIEKEPPEVRMARSEPSATDAMGLDKRREVVGGSYSPSIAKQATLYGIFLVVLAALVIGGKMLADELDQPPDTVEDQAPWAAPDAQQRPPAPLQ